MAESGYTRTCGYCGALCPTSAEICYRCKKTIGKLARFRRHPDEIAARAARLAAGDLPPHPPVAEQPGRFRTSTVVLSVVAFAGLSGCALGGDTGLAFGTLVGIFVFPFAIYRGIVDLAQPSPRDRRSPERAARCFARALRTRRFDAAMACVSPLHSSETVLPVGVLPGTRLKEQHPIALNDAAALARYFRAVLAAPRGDAVVLTRAQARRTGGEGNIDVWQIDLQAATYSRLLYFALLLGLIPGAVLIAALQTRHDVSFEVLLYFHERRWWIERADLPRA
jgi:hypothetical protein